MYFTLHQSISRLFFSLIFGGFLQFGSPVPCIIFSLVQASGLEHLIKDDISDTGKNKFDVVRIGGRSQMWIDWPFFQIDLTLAQKSIDYEVGGFCHIVFTLKLGKTVWLFDYN